MNEALTQDEQPIETKVTVDWVAKIEEKLERLAIAVDGEKDESSVRGIRNRLRAVEKRQVRLEAKVDRLLERSGLTTWSAPMDQPNPNKTAHVPSVFKPHPTATFKATQEFIDELRAERDREHKEVVAKGETIERLEQENERMLRAMKWLSERLMETSEALAKEKEGKE